MSDTSSNLAHLSSTIESLSQGLAHAKTGAVRSLHSWGTTLGNSHEPGLKAITDELKQLETVLGESEIDAPKLRKTLHALGKHTTAAAGSAGGATADKLKELGQLLTEAASQLN